MRKTVTNSVSALVDADILIKLSVIDCYSECWRSLEIDESKIATLRSMTFSAGIRKQNVRERRAGMGAPAARLLGVLNRINTIDKLTDQETAMSALISSISQKYGLAIDGGEAMLLSICIEQGTPILTTGDKKAIRSLPALAARIPAVRNVAGRIVSLEHILLRIVRNVDFSIVLGRLKAGQHCDKGLAHILSVCGDSQVELEKQLEVRIDQLRTHAGEFVYASTLPTVNEL